MVAPPVLLQTFKNPLQRVVYAPCRLLLSRHAGVLITFCQIVKNYYRLISQSNLMVSAWLCPQTGNFRKQPRRWSG